MSNQKAVISIKQTPFVFLKALFIIEFFFALLPFLLTLLLNAAALYENTPLAGQVSYNIFSVIAVTSVQALILAIAFILWFVPTYQIDSEQIIHLRHNLLNDKMIAQTQMVKDTAVHFGPLGKRFNYGSIILQLNQPSILPKLKNIPNPQQTAQDINELAGTDTAVLPAPVLALDIPAQQLISQGEGQYLEFKSSFIWDYHRGNANKSLHVPVLKNLTAFMNTQGGILLIGVSDDGEILGLEPDFKLMKKKDEDGWENTFNMAFNRMIGPEFRQYVTITFEKIDDKIISKIQVIPAPEPVYLNVDGKEDFYIKTGNGSQPLSVRQANNYIQTHFSK